MTLKSNLLADNISVANFEITRELDQKVTFSSRFDYPKILGRSNLPAAVTADNNYTFFDYTNSIITSGGSVLTAFIPATGSGFKEISVAAPSVDQNLSSSQIIPHVYFRIRNVAGLDSNMWRPLNGGFVFRYIKKNPDTTAQLFSNNYVAGAANDTSNSGYFGGQFVYSSYSGGVLKVGIGMQLGYTIAGPAGGIRVSLGEIYDIYNGNGANRNFYTTAVNTWNFTALAEIDVYVVWVY